MRRFAMIALLALSIGCPEESTQTQPPPPQPQSMPMPPPNPPATPPANPELAAGRKLYLTACANCHGPDGTGSMMRQALPTIGDLSSPEMHGRLKDEDIIGIVQNGRNNKMPAFGTMFNEEQLKHLVAYVRTLKKP